MTYKVTVNVENEKCCGVFEFEKIEDAARKVSGNIWTFDESRIEDAIKSQSKDNKPAFFWCTDERGSFCRVFSV